MKVLHCVSVLWEEQWLVKSHNLIVYAVLCFPVLEFPPTVKITVSPVSFFLHTCMLLCLSVTLCSTQASRCHGVSPEGLLGRFVQVQSQTLVLMAPLFSITFYLLHLCVFVNRFVIVCVHVIEGRNRLPESERSVLWVAWARFVQVKS